MSAAEVAEANEILNDTIESGVFEINKRIEELNKQIAEYRLGVETATDNIVDKRGADEKRWTFSVLNGIFDYLELVRDGGNLTGAAKRSIDKFIIDINNARQTRIGNISQGVKELNDYLKKNFSMAERKAMIEMREDLAKFDKFKRKTSIANLLNTVLTYEQSDMVERVKEATKRYAKKLEKNPNAIKPDILVQADMINDMMVAIGPKILQVGTTLKNLINNTDRISKMAEVHKNISASNLDIRPGYWTILHEQKPSVATGGNVGIFKGFLKKRTYSEEAITTQASAFDVAQKHLIEVETFNAFGDIFLSAKYSYLAPDVMKKLGLAMGSATMKRMSDLIADEINGGPLVKGTTIAPLDAFTTFVVYKGLSWNPISPFKQVFDFASVGALLPGFGKYWVASASPEGWAASVEMSKHPAVLARMRDGYNQHTSEVIEEARGLGAGHFKKALTSGMKLVQYGDAASVFLSAGAAYRAALDLDGIKQIADSAERKKAAQNMAVQFLERALQSPHKTDRPHFAARGGSTARLFSVFSSALTPKVAQLMKEIDTLRLAGKENTAAWKRLTRKVFVYHGVAAALQFVVSLGVQLGFTDDELDEGELWELAGTMALGPFAGVPLLGTGIESAMAGATGGAPRTDVSGSFMRDIYNFGDLMGETAQFATGHSEKDRDEMMRMVFEKLFRGVPLARRIDQFIDKWLD